MSKTPYEIRLELLKLANEILVTPVYQKRQALYEEFAAKREVFAGQHPTQDQLSLTYPTMPDFPSTTDIIAEAEKLNKFVSQQ